MPRRINSTPRADGYHMPGEFEPQKRIYMIWPERSDNWRDGAKPAQKAYTDVAEAVSAFTPVTMLVSAGQYEHVRAVLSDKIKVLEMSSNDAWCRDIGPTFVVNERGDMRGVDWVFNAWGGLVDGLYFPWDLDDQVARKICELEGVDSYRTEVFIREGVDSYRTEAFIPEGADSYRTEGFILEGGSIHVDGEGTVLTTEMCLLSSGRNPHLTKVQIEEKLKEYLGAEKVLWLQDGIDPEETNGHVDDVACFIRPGEVACIWTDDESHPFYEAAQKACRQLEGFTDAKGRKLKVHKLVLPKEPVRIGKDFAIDVVAGSIPRREGDLCIASYANFLITNGGVIVPQFGDENDGIALKQIREMFPRRKVVGVMTREIVYGGGNIHCITQQVPVV